jgi:hypothetical protein
VVLLDHRDGGAHLARLQGRDVAAGAGADDRDVEVIRHIFYPQITQILGANHESIVDVPNADFVLPHYFFQDSRLLLSGRPHNADS